MVNNDSMTQELKSGLNLPGFQLFGDDGQKIIQREVQ
ncbi:hypothetical protein PVOR_04958 [Paenibacillus vortex V453]|uniref:Uncharacterized protein n=1 Tax=Paenibacillus vortex V453 TaxID=715225 RepID=A0A2R9T0C3_9BACL|nr:hypothetical protein PVOR_04958 [Paenibacillus vortex V453]